MPNDAVELDDLGVLRIRGTDAERFLQGQLSNDLDRLAREGSLLAGLHNPQGRTIALLRLVQVSRAAAGGEQDILALLPRELVAPVAARLGRYVLRAKVRLTDESAAWRVRGIVRSEMPAGLAIPLPGTPERWISVEPADAPVDAPPSAPMQSPVSASGAQPAPAPSARSTPRREWRLLDIAAGLPQVYASTSELFVAQMLNLDAIGAISFSKGCYTGQEVIARAHYRGRVKRRMQRWRTVHPASLAPGDSARLADGRTLRVVDAEVLADGRCELLAIAPLAAGSAAAADGDDAPGEAGALLDADALSLPYELPA